MNTDIDWLRLAFNTAADHSDDFDTQNGAVLVPLVGFGVAAANCLPGNVAASPARLKRPAKYRWIEHAERGAIYAAAKSGTKTDKATLYTCWFACPDCARAIIEAGIREVVGHVKPRSLTPDRWLADVSDGERMLMEAGVSVRWLNATMGVTIRFNGESLPC